MPTYFYDHIHIISPDPEKSARFYEKVFNAKMVAVTPHPQGGNRVELSIQGTRLLIKPPRDAGQSAEDVPAKRLGLEHWGLGTDDIEAAVADLKANGATILEGIKSATPPSTAKVAFVMGPDNVMIEVVQPSS
jgi:catechol 2,3-dioxygenase-like lactoylglutathione lyase family enzyme